MLPRCSPLLCFTVEQSTNTHVLCLTLSTEELKSLLWRYLTQLVANDGKQFFINVEFFSPFIILLELTGTVLVHFNSLQANMNAESSLLSVLTFFFPKSPQ